MTKKGNHLVGEIEITKENRVFSNRYMEVFNDEVKFPSGADGTYLRILCPDGNESVGVLPITPDGKIILIRTFRHGIRGWGYEIPKGGIISGENIEEAALRELKEETGIEADTLIYVGDFCESPAIFAGNIKCFFAPGCIMDQSETELENTEAISGTRVFDIEEYLNDNSLDFCDAVTKLMVYIYKEKRDLHVI